MLACLVDLVMCFEVAVSTEVLAVEIVELLRVLSVKNVTGLDALIEYYVCIIVPALNFCLFWSGCHFL